MTHPLRSFRLEVGIFPYRIEAGTFPVGTEVTMTNDQRTGVTAVQDTVPSAVRIADAIEATSCTINLIVSLFVITL